MIAAVIICLIISYCLVPTYLISSGNAALVLLPFYRVRVAETKLCRGLDAQTGLPIDVQKPYSTTDKQLEVCASLEIDYIGKGGYPVPLYFLWRYEGNPIYASETQMYSPGYIVGSLQPRSGEHFQPGTYQVEIRSGRSMYASIEFSVVAEK